MQVKFRKFCKKVVFLNMEEINFKYLPKFHSKWRRERRDGDYITDSSLLHQLKQGHICTLYTKMKAKGKVNPVLMEVKEVCNCKLYWIKILIFRVFPVLFGSLKRTGPVLDI